MQIVTCLLFIAGAVRAAEPAVSVEVVTPLKSGPVARIVVALNGKPVPGAKVAIYKYEGARGAIPVVTLLCDEYGWIKTPKLADGQYGFVAQVGKDLQAGLFLDVSSRDGTMAFEMDLRPSPPERAHVDLTNPENVPITKRLQAFRGTVTDPSGAVLPKASIRIVRRGAGGTKVVNEIKSGINGDFQAELPTGTYVAIFSAPGFKTYVVGFEIAPDGSSRLDVKLDIGPVSEEVEIG